MWDKKKPDSHQPAVPEQKNLLGTKESTDAVRSVDAMATARRGGWGRVLHVNGATSPAPRILIDGRSKD